MNASGATSITFRSIDLATRSKPSISYKASYIGRRYQHDAPHSFRLQRLDRARYRQIGLTGACRADPEGKIVRPNIVQIRGLIGAARAHRAARGAHLEFLRRIVRVGLCLVALHVQCLKRDVHALRIHRFALCPGIQILQHRLGSPDRGRRSDDLKSIAAPPQLDAEPRLNLMQVLVKGTAQLGQPPVVGRCEHQIPRHGHGIHGGASATRCPRNELGMASVMITSAN
jgi:hypothetical protein